MAIVLDGTTGITSTGNAVLGDAGTDTLNVASNTLVTDGANKVGINKAVPVTDLHIANGTTSGGTVRLENTLTSVAIGNFLGNVEFFGNDNSTNANGVRAKISAYATSATGGTSLRFYTATSNTTTLTQGLAISGSTVSATSLQSTFMSIGVDGQFSQGNGVTFAGSLTMGGGDTTIDVDITGYFSANLLSNYFMEARVNGVYVDNPATPVTINRLFKAWAQNINYTGSTYAIAGAVLMYAAYNSDATNFPAGAVNAVKVQTIVTATQVLLRFTNRTSPAGTSFTTYAYEVKVISV
jgi:hypothetical protein